jgi:hypothetical protein
MQSSTSRTRSEDSRSKIKRGKGTVQGQRTLDTHHCGTKQLHISNAKRSHGRIGNLNTFFRLSYTDVCILNSRSQQLKILFI